MRSLLQPLSQTLAKEVSLVQKVTASNPGAFLTGLRGENIQKRVKRGFRDGVRVWVRVGTPKFSFVGVRFF